MPRKRKVVVKNQENEEPVEKVVEKPKKATQAEKPAKKQKREPEFMTGDGLNVIKTILSVQKTDCNSQKALAELKKLYEKMSHSDFMKSFMAALQVFLIRDDGDEYASRGLKFMGVFVAEYGEVMTESGASHPIIETFFKEILEITSAVVHVRTRICLLVTNTMSSFSQRAELDESIIEKISERMLYFMKDISPLVRTQAVFALQRLQDPDSSEDPVTKSFVYHMEADPAVKVRQATITAIAKKLQNFPAILDRLHDVDEKVRRHTYLQISSYSVKSYKIADRIAILSAGLNDRSDIVRKAVTNLLLSNWIGVYDFDYAEFIRAIKLDSNEKELIKFRSLAEMALHEIFKKRKLNDIISYLNGAESKEFKNCLQLEKSTLEMLIVWKMITKCYQDYLNGKRRSSEIKDDVGSDDEEESSLANQTVSNMDFFPELSVFCDYVENFVNNFNFGTDLDEKYQKIYFSQCLVMLLQILQLNDLDDEVGKERLQKLLKTILLTYDISEFAIEEIAHVIEKIIPVVEQRLIYFNQIVIEMIKPGVPSEYSRQTIIDELIDRSEIDRKVQAKAIKLRMMDLKEQESQFVNLKQYAECQKVSEEYHKLNEELVELLKPVAELHSSDSTQSLLDNLSSVVTSSKKITSSDILKNLRICYYAVMTKGVKTITHDILQIYNEFVRFHLESTDLSTRMWALKTATAYSLLYESIAKEIYLIIKSQVFKSSHVLIWECSIECIFDLLLHYGIEKMENENNDANNLSMSINSQNRSKRGGRTLYTNVEDDEDEQDEMNIVKTLDIMQMLHHLLEQSDDLRITKVLICGFCKMILHGAYCTRELMSKFLLMYFNPATPAEISQLLGVFLENIIKKKKQEYLHHALTPTIFTLVEAPYDSPLREVKLETVLKYIVNATRPIFCSNGLNLHNTLGMEFLNIMKENPDSKEILKIFAKELSELEIGEDAILKKDMTKQIETILKESSADARTKKYLTDFCKMLNGTYRTPLTFSSTAKAPKINEEEEEDDDQLENIEEENEEEQKPDQLLDEILDDEIQTTSNVQVKELEVKLKKIEVTADTSMSSVVSPKKDESQQPEDSLNETEIPQSPAHVDLPATQAMDNVEIAATQNITKFDLTTLDSSQEDVSIISSDVPMTPQTPLTVKRLVRQKPNTSISSMSTVNETQENVEYPPTPESRLRRNLLSNAKRQLEISKSTPVTPSQSSPLRKNPKKVPETSNFQSSPEVTPPSRSRLSKTTSTPITTSGRMTRNQAKVEVAQNTTLTRSASKTLNVKPTTSMENDKSETKEAKKKSTSKLPVRKPTIAVKQTAASTLRATRIRNAQNASRPPWK